MDLCHDISYLSCWESVGIYGVAHRLKFHANTLIINDIFHTRYYGYALF